MVTTCFCLHPTLIKSKVKGQSHNKDYTKGQGQSHNKGHKDYTKGQGHRAKDYG